MQNHTGLLDCFVDYVKGWCLTYRNNLWPTALTLVTICYLSQSALLFKVMPFLPTILVFMNILFFSLYILTFFNIFCNTLLFQQGNNVLARRATAGTFASC